MSKIYKIVIRFVLISQATLQKPENTAWPGLMNLLMHFAKKGLLFMCWIDEHFFG